MLRSVLPIIFLRFFLPAEAPEGLQYKNQDQKFLRAESTLTPEGCVDLLAFQFRNENQSEDKTEIPKNGIVSFCDKEYRLFVIREDNTTENMDPGDLTANTTKRVRFTRLQNEKLILTSEYESPRRMFVLTPKKAFPASQFIESENAILFRSSGYLYLADLVYQPARLKILDDSFNGASSKESELFWNAISGIRVLPDWNLLLLRYSYDEETQTALYNTERDVWELPPLSKFPRFVWQKLEAANVLFHFRDDPKNDGQGYFYFKIYAGDQLIKETTPVKSGLSGYETFQLPEGDYTLSVERYFSRSASDSPGGAAFRKDRNIRQPGPVRIKTRGKNRYLIEVYPGLPGGRKKYAIRASVLFSGK